DDQKALAPAPMCSDEAGDKSAKKTSDHGSRNVRRHGSADTASFPFFIDVSQHDCDHSRHEDALGKAPEDQLGEARRSRSQSRGSGQQKKRGNNYLLAAS